MNRAFFDAYYRAISTADYVTLAECYDENVQLGSLGGTIHGRDEVLERIAEARTRVDNSVIPHDMLIEGDRAAVVFTDRFIARADGTEMFGRTLAAGEHVDVRVCGIYRFVDGRIAEVEMFRAP